MAIIISTESAFTVKYSHKEKNGHCVTAKEPKLKQSSTFIRRTKLEPSLRSIVVHHVSYVKVHTYIYRICQNKTLLPFMCRIWRKTRCQYEAGHQWLQRHPRLAISTFVGLGWAILRLGALILGSAAGFASLSLPELAEEDSELVLSILDTVPSLIRHHYHITTAGQWRTKGHIHITAD